MSQLCTLEIAGKQNKNIFDQNYPCGVASSLTGGSPGGGKGMPPRYGCQWGYEIYGAEQN